MTNFKQFQNDIKNIGNIWSSNDVYFMQTKDSYSATFKPYYPSSSTRDMIIKTIDRTGAYKRGNYELIVFDDEGEKYTSEYFDTIDQLKCIWNRTD